MEPQAAARMEAARRHEQVPAAAACPAPRAARDRRAAQAGFRRAERSLAARAAAQLGARAAGGPTALRALPVEPSARTAAARPAFVRQARHAPAAVGGADARAVRMS